MGEFPNVRKCISVTHKQFHKQIHKNDSAYLQKKKNILKQKKKKTIKKIYGK